MRALLAYVLALVVAVVALSPDVASAHALEPGYLDIQELQKDSYVLSWKVPDVGGEPMGITAVLPDNCAIPTPPALSPVGTSYVARWQTQCPGGLSGKPIRIDGLEATRTDVLIRFQHLDGATGTLRLTPDNTVATMAENPGFWSVVTTYFWLGVDHILTGLDHILFVLALILLVGANWALVKTITAFTVAHSITLSAAALGFVHIPVPPVEAMIALSIVFLAVEIVRRDPDHPGLAERKPWLVAFSFGLLHGLGFASALSETGLPQNDIPAALLTFNIGVEAGQLMFVAAILVLRVSLRAIDRQLHLPKSVGANMMVALVYGIGGISSYWLIDRVAGFVL